MKLFVYGPIYFYITSKYNMKEKIIGHKLNKSVLVCTKYAKTHIIDPYVVYYDDSCCAIVLHMTLS